MPSYIFTAESTIFLINLSFTPPGRKARGLFLFIRCQQGQHLIGNPCLIHL